MANAQYTADRSRRLALIRQLLLRAERDAELPEPLCAQALLTLHDAAELFLVVAAQATSAPVKKGAAFLEYWQPIDGALAPKQLGHKASMTAMSAARVAFKHSGVIASRAEIQRLARATREFLVEGTQVVFDVRLDEVSMSDLVPVQEVRESLKLAEDDLASGNLNSAVGHAKLAFEHLMREEAPNTVGSRTPRRRSLRERFVFDSSHSLRLKELVDRKFASAWDKVIETLKSNEFAVRLLSKGVNYDDYLKFEALTPQVFYTFGTEGPQFAYDPALVLTADEAAWCLEFATVSALAVLT